MSRARKPKLPTKHRAKLKFGANAMMILGLFAAYCFVNVWQNARINHWNRQNEALRRDIKAIQRQCDALTLEIEKLKDPERIKRVLSEHMILEPAEKINIKKLY